MPSISNAHPERILASIFAAKLYQHRQRAREALDGGAPLVVQQHVERHERPTLGQGVMRLQFNRSSEPSIDQCDMICATCRNADMPPLHM